MADAQVTLKVLLESAGIKPTAAQLDKLSASMQKTAGATKNLSREQNKTKRNMEGVSQRSGRQGKDFARLSQGMGGLVQAYATVAANVFALSSAFLVLRRAADLSSMIKSAENFSARYGISVTNVTRRIQQATGGAISFSDALSTVNKAVSANVPIEQMEQLAIAATKAAQTFGGTANEALNRFISASQRGRVEIIQTLGVVIKTEQAYERYAASIGKTAQELTAFDRQQAILNATIAESQNVFDGIVIDPNPFQRLLTTIVDLKDDISTFITDGLTPMINAFNQSKAAAAALITLIVGIVSKKIFPEISKEVEKLQLKSIESTKRARTAAIQAANAEVKFVLNTQQKLTSLTRKELIRRSTIFRTYYSDVLLQHKSFGKQLIDETGKVNAAILTEQRAAISRELAARQRGTGMQKAFVGIPTNVLTNEANRLSLIAKNTEGAAVAQQKLAAATNITTDRFKVFFARTTTGWQNFRAQIITARSSLTTGFSKSFATMQTNVILGIKAMNLEWTRFIASIEGRAGTAALEAFSRAFGRTVGVVIGGITRLFRVALSLTLAISTVTLLWELFGEKLLTTSPIMDNIKDSTDTMIDSLEASNEVLAETINKWGTELPNSLRDFRGALDFLGGAFDSISAAANRNLGAITEALGNLTPTEAITRLQGLNKELDTLLLAGIRVQNQQTGDLEFVGEALERSVELREEINRITEAFAALSRVQFIDPVIDSLEGAFNAARRVGFQSIPQGVIDSLEDSNLRKVINEASFIEFRAAINEGDFDALRDAITDIEQGFADDDKQLGLFRASLLEFLRLGAAGFQSLSRSASSALKQLEETNENISTFFSGQQKLLSQKSPYKELFGDILDANRALEELQKTGISTNTLLSDAFEGAFEGGEIRAILSLLGDTNLSIEESQRRLQALEDSLAAQLKNRLVSSQKLKVIQEELSAAKLIEATSDKNAVELVELRLKLEQDLTKAKLRTAQLDLIAANNILEITKNSSEADAESIAVRQAERDVILATVKALGIKLGVQQDSLDAVKEEFKYRFAELKNIEAINKVYGQRLAILKSISRNNQEDLKLREEIYKSNLEDLNNQRQTLLLEIQQAQQATRQTDEQRRTIALNREKLLLLDAQTRELERQALFLRAEQAEQGGKFIFDEEGISLTAEFFVREIRDKARDLKTTFQILGQGFANAINTTFDTAVDTLLEGGKDFGRIMVETIKEQLRNVFGEALKTQIRDAFAGIFSIETKEQQDQRRHTEAQEASKVQTTAMYDNTEALRSVEKAFRDCANKIPSTVPIGPGGPRKPGEEEQGITLGKLDELVKTTQSGNSEVATIFQLGNEIAKEAKDSNISGLFNIFSILGTLISVIGSSSAASGIGSIFGGLFENGGMIPGGVRRLADGDVVRRPELAVIGEGRNSEAVVPLPNNREIPVDIRGATGDNINIEQNFDFRNADPSAIPRLRAEAKRIGDETFNRVFQEINKGGSYAKISGRR